MNVDLIQIVTFVVMVAGAIAVGWSLKGVETLPFIVACVGLVALQVGAMIFGFVLSLTGR